MLKFNRGMGEGLLTFFPGKGRGGAYKREGAYLTGEA